jgi:hypothetical protein
MLLTRPLTPHTPTSRRERCVDDRETHVPEEQRRVQRITVNNQLEAVR